MTSKTSPDTLVDAYLQRLHAVSGDLSEPTRAELIDNITAHLAETAPAGSDEVTVRQALDDLGSPEAVASAARAEDGRAGGAVPATEGRGNLEAGRLYDVATILALLLGGFVVPFLGWIAGVVMLWAGPRWTPGEKVVATAALPIALMVAGLIVLGSEGSSVVPLLVGGPVLLAGVLVVLIVLLRRARSRAPRDVVLVEGV